MNASRILVSTLFILSVAASVADADNGVPPEVVDSAPPYRNLFRLPDGTLQMLYLVPGEHAASVTSTDSGQTWSQPKVEFEFTQPNSGISLTLVDRSGELQAFLMVKRGSGSPSITGFYDVWHCRTKGKRTEWTRPKRIFAGYVGSLNGVTQLKSGRIVLAQQYWVTGRKSAPPTGSHVVTTNYSDDDGATWQLAPVQLTAPCNADYVGNNYGACEPTILELKDGRAWMLMRTQTGFLYESFSPDGVKWSAATPARFRSSNSPSSLLRLSDGRIALFWNNCEDPSRVDGASIYTTRDVLHVAISSDEGKTWLGYREVFLDPHRNEPPPKRGDRGTAYPFTTQADDGKIILGTGQGRGRIALLRVDPNWITATHHEDDFSHGLDGWSTFKPFGPASGYWRNRTAGPHLVPHPQKPASKVLHVRRPDKKAGDEAVWNFPASHRGTLTLRILLQKDFGGAEIALADRFIQPGDPVAQKLAAFRLPINSRGTFPAGSKLEHDRWYTLKLAWNLDRDQCHVSVDGKHVTTLDRVNSDTVDISYLRLRSTAVKLDTAGFLIERVDVDIGS